MTRRTPVRRHARVLEPGVLVRGDCVNFDHELGDLAWAADRRLLAGTDQAIAQSSL
jgi:hypothetical protein